MLVTMSARRRSVGSYLAARVRRIVPAYLTVLVFCAVILGPIIYYLTHSTVAGYFHLGTNSPFTYVLRNALFPMDLQYGVADVFTSTTPYGQAVGDSVINGSLWSLPIEVRCYLLALLVVLVGRRFGVSRVATAALGLSAVLVMTSHFRPDIAESLAPEYLPVTTFELVFVFLCGVLVGANADRLELNARLVAPAFAVFGVTALVGGAVFSTLGLGSLCVVLPAIASRLPLRSAGILRNDLSYGAYLWAFPIQQSMSFFGFNKAPLVIYVTLAAGLTLLAALCSWRLVERPVLLGSHTNVGASVPVPSPADATPGSP